MDHSVLAHVLKRPERIDTQPARLVGWNIKMWGEYPALVAGSTKDIIRGAAYEVQTITDRDKLIQYEISAYRLQECRVEFYNGSSVMGKTFIWNGDQRLLREGSFDLKDWKLKQREFL